MARIVDSDFVAERLARELAVEAADVFVGEASFSLLRSRLELHDLRVVRPRVATFAADRLVLSGLPFFTEEEDEPTILGRLVATRPMLFYHPAASPTARERPADAAADSVAFRVGELRIEDATGLVWRIDAVRGPRAVLVRDLHVDGRGIAFDRAGWMIGSPKNLEWRTGPFRRVRADGLTELTFDSTRASSRDSSLLLHGGRFQPTHPDDEFFRRRDSREDRIRANLPHIRVRGLDFGMLPPRGLVARAVEFDSVDIDVLTERRLPTGTARPWTPRSLVRSVERRLRLDSVLVRGRVEYRDRPVERALGAGRIDFEDLDATIRGISNEPGIPPMEITAEVRVFDAPADVGLQVPLQGSRFQMSMEGRVGGIDLRKLNSLTVPLEGIEFQAGRLEGMRFDITVEGSSAGGTVWVAYRDLDVQIVDRRTGEGGLFDDIKSFLANTFVFRGDNMPSTDEGDEPAIGAVEYYVPPGDSFFSRVWGPIRSGLMTVAKK